MNRIDILEYQANEVVGCTEDPLAIDCAQEILSFCQEVKNGERTAVLEEIDKFEKLIIKLLYI